MEKNKLLDVVFILDKSGSMGGSEENTITSFNEYLERERKNKYKTRITTILFSDEWNYLHKGENVLKVNPITSEEYYVGGCTALYDALGEGINYIQRKKDKDKVLFIVITDGYENASRKFNQSKIRKMIKEHGNWEFIYIGADIDSFAAGSDIGFKRNNIASFKKDKKGTSILFDSIGKAEACMMGEKCLSRSWKEELDEYIDNNK